MAKTADENVSKAGAASTPQQRSAAGLDAFRGDPNFMTSLARGLIVLEAFSQIKRPVTVSLLSGRTGLSRAAVRRCLYTLTSLGFAASDDSQKFVLLPRVLALGYGYLSSMPFSHAAQPVLNRLGGMLRESCSVSVLDGDDIVYIARASITRIMSVDLSIGSRLPAFCTSMGRVLLANLPAGDVESYFQRVQLRSYTDRTVTSASKLKQLLRAVQRSGYAIVDQELEEGLRSIAVPIRNPAGKVVAALNAGTQAQRVQTVELQSKFLPNLLAAAQEIGMLLS
jgi:IclR family transcriptional regulator, pca regulon regulatory protein